MKSKLIIVADLGCLKAYKLEHDGLSTSPKLELIETLNNGDGRGRLSEKVTEQGGRVRGGARGAKGVQSSGERHNMQTESDKRIVKHLAGRIERLAKLQLTWPIYFAADKEIHRPILDRLDPAVRARITKMVPEDLTKINGTKLLGHFAPA